MSGLRRKMVSALVAAMSIRGFSGGIDNFACASSVADPSAYLDGLINGVMPSNDSPPAPISYASGPLKKFDGRLMYGTQGNNFMPWLIESYLGIFTDVSSVALWVWEKSKNVDIVDKVRGTRLLKSFVGDKIFEDCKKRWDSDYDSEAVCAALYSLVKEFNEYCGRLKAVIDGLPVDTSKVNVGVLSQSEERSGSFDSGRWEKNIVYDCVVRLASAVLNLFTK